MENQMMCLVKPIPAAVVTASLVGVLATSSLAEQQTAVTSPKTLVILQAEYGAEDKWIDVTDRVAAAVRDNTLVIQAGNDLAGDPIPGVVKQLTVVYTLDGEPHTALVPEFGLLVIQSDHALEELAELSRRRGIYLPFRHVNRCRARSSRTRRRQHCNGTGCFRRMGNRLPGGWSKRSAGRGNLPPDWRPTRRRRI
jgi:hypothetical protein